MEPNENDDKATERQLQALQRWGVTGGVLGALDKRTASTWLSEFVAGFKEGRPHRPDIRERPPEPGQPEAPPAPVPVPTSPATPPEKAPVPAFRPASAPVEPTPRPSAEREEMDTLRAVVFPDASDVELRLVLQMARNLNLDPRRGQIHAFRVGGRPIVTVGIDGYRVIAEDSGQYDGQDPPKLETAPDGKLVSATVTVYRRGMSRGVSATAWWDEYARDTHPWRNMPRVMLSKVAEALALRKCFPRGLSGTYTPEELDQAQVAVPLSPPRVELAALPARRRGRPPKPPVTPEPTIEAPARSPRDLAAEAQASIDAVRRYLDDMSAPADRRTRVLDGVRDLLEAWGVSALSDFPGLCGRQAEVGAGVVDDLRLLVDLTREAGP